MSGVRVVLEGVSKRYGRGEVSVDAVSDVNLVMEAGEFVAIVGPSGSGKSTLLHLVGALDTPTSGTIFVDGVEVSKMEEAIAAHFRNETVGFIFQNFYLQQHLSAVENVELPLLIRGVPPKERYSRTQEAMEAVGLGERLWHRPNQLSGGECQRVAIARAIVTEPRLLLADEPTGNLDTATGMDVIRLMEKLNREYGMTMVVVTHDSSVADFARRRIQLRDGRVVKDEYAQD